MKNLIAASLLFFAILGAQANGSNLSDQSFTQSLSQIQTPQPPIHADTLIQEKKIILQLSKEIADRLGWYGQLDQKPGISAQSMSRIVVQGLKKGTYDAVIMGESHDNPIEQSAAHLIIGNILASGVHIGAFMSEATTVENGAPVGLFSPEPFINAHVSTGLFVNQFNPEADIERGLKMAGSGILITYTGSVHTSIAMRNYSQESLKEPDLGWNKIFPGRPTVEQSILRHQKHPIIIAMRDESSVLNWIEYSAIAQTSKNTNRTAFKENLAALKRAWDEEMSHLASRSTIGFIRSPNQPNLYLGITPSDRRPLEIEALIKTIHLPEFSQWIGNNKIISTEANLICNCSLTQSSCCARSQVFIYSGKKTRKNSCFWH